MIISHSLYIELLGDIVTVRAALRRGDLWAILPTGAVYTGTLWRWGEDLYRVTIREDHNRIEFEATPVVKHGGRLHIAIELHDAGVSTHASVMVSLDAPAFFWNRSRIRRGLQQRVQLCVEIARRELEQQNTAQQHTESPLHKNHDAHILLDNRVETLRTRYPSTVAAFEQMGALDHLERVYRLEEGWHRIAHGAFDDSFYIHQSSIKHQASSIKHQASYDLIYAGGGLGLLHAVAMAHKGWRVLLFDRGEVGCAHREWNISKKELATLVDEGIATWNELQAIVMREYRTGLVRFFSGPQTGLHNDVWLPHVLDVALDAGALLRLMRRKLEAAGGTVLDGRLFKRVVVTDNLATKAQRHGEQDDLSRCPKETCTVDVEVTNIATGTQEMYRGRLLLDGMGSTSPLALIRHKGHPFAGVCPTVGTVAEGFVAGNTNPRHHDPTLGDILITVTDAQRGQQYMWEGFPGRGDELTVYLFYYDVVKDERRKTKDEGNTFIPDNRQPTTDNRQPSTRHHSLLALFEDYFSLLPSYKEPGEDFRHLKPVYGYIPARHTLRRQEAPFLRGVLPVGDSAAQQSPLTFCGFGSHVRNLPRTTGLLDYALRHGLTAPEQVRHISAFQANVSLNWVFSRFMHPWGKPQSVNHLQNIFLGVLNDLGRDLTTRFFQDRMRWSDYHKMVLGMFKRYPPVVGVAWRVLGFAGCRQWVTDYLCFSGEALLATVGRAVGPRSERLIYAVLDVLAPRWSLAARARYAEWRAMGWVQ